MKKKTPPPLKGTYRTLHVPVDAPDVTDAAMDRLPASIREQLQLLSLISNREDNRSLNATPETLQQETLVAFLENQIDFDEDLIEMFRAEMRADDPNDPLFLRYYVQGSAQLEVLLLHCIDRYPTDRDLLYDLAYLHEYRDVKSPLVERYHRALALEQSMADFDALAADMCSLEIFQSSDQMKHIRQLLATSSEKLAVVERHMRTHRPNEDENPT